MSTYPELSLIGIQNPPVNGVQQPELIYEICDPVARAQSATAGRNKIAWRGNAQPNVALIPAGVVVTYQDTEYTGTLQPDDPSVFTNCRYLVYRGPSSDGNNLYQEYVVCEDPQDDTNVWWEPVGYQNVNLEDLGQLAFEDAVILEKGSGVDVLGKNTNLSATAPNVTMSNTKTGIKAGLKTNAAVGANGTANAVTGYPNPTTETFVGSVSDTKQKLKTTSIQEAGAGVNINTKVSRETSKMVRTTVSTVDGTETVSHVTNKTDAKLVKSSVRGVKSTTTEASKVTIGTSGKLKKTSIKKVTNANSVTYPSVGTSYDSSTKKLTINITAGVLPTFADQDVATGDFAASGDTEGVAIPSVSASDITVPIADDNTTTVATGDATSEGTGATVLTGFTNTEKTVAKKKATDTTLATGELDAAGTGATVVKEVTIGSQEFATVKNTTTVVATGKVGSTDTNGDDVVTAVTPTNGTNPAITGLGTPTTAAALTGVQVTQQPVVEIQTETAGDGDVDVITDSSATASAPVVTAGNNDIVKVAAFDALSVQAGDLTDMDDEEV